MQGRGEPSTPWSPQVNYLTRPHVLQIFGCTKPLKKSNTVREDYRDPKRREAHAVESTNHNILRAVRQLSTTPRPCELSFFSSSRAKDGSC